jgi:hypothetical protein
MEKTFTILDLQHYLQEISFLEKKTSGKMRYPDGPGRLTIQNLLRYSSALNILKTSTVGNIYQLTN